MGKYDDIINLPHHVSKTHSHMSIHDRAAQFASFQPLRGYGDAIRETARLTDERVELTGDEKAVLDRKLQELAGQIGSRPQVTLICFQPDEKKAGGAYISVTGQLKKMDDFEGVLVLADGRRILIEDILDIQTPCFL